MTLTEPAFAKVNLCLHVTGRRADGYHLLDSLVVFPGIGDRLDAEPGPGLSLSLSGPFASALSGGGDNLVLRAAEALRPVGGSGAALHLEKELPVAAGIGGGSSDAAAALRLLSRMWSCPVPDGLALSIGADVPVCLAAPQAQWMRGIGERLTPAAALPPFWMVLVNPLVGVPTGRVFDGLETPDNAPATPPGSLRTFRDLTDWLSRQRNDLEVPARAVSPVIGQVLDALGAAALARMSGSGATCFGLVETKADAISLSDRIRTAEPNWWVAAAPVAS